MFAVEKETSNAMEKISDLERELNKLKLRPAYEDQKVLNVMTNTVAIGNIKGATTFEAGKEWIASHCKAADLRQPLDSSMYFKTKYTGIIFMKCVTAEERDKFVLSINEVAKSMGGPAKERLFAKVDQPIDVRMAESTLFRMKTVLVAWGYAKGCIKVDTDVSPVQLTIAGKEIVRARVDNYCLNLKWEDGEWESWEALQASEELSTIKSEVQAKLNSAKDFSQSKGKGKNASE